MSSAYFLYLLYERQISALGNAVDFLLTVCSQPSALQMKCLWGVLGT
jgi:hypothetical protein